MGPVFFVRDEIKGRNTNIASFDNGYVLVWQAEESNEILVLKYDVEEY